MGRRKSLWAVVIGLLFLCRVGITAPFAEEKDGQEELNLYAQSAVLMDGKSGRVLWEKNGDVIRPMASTTKIMTCILALEHGLGGDMVTEVSGYAASQPQVHLGMHAGQRFYTRDLLYSLMLESHNDSAVAIAEAAAGSVPDFAKEMNRKAKELGCKDTWFITPNGLDGKETDETGREHIHSTTARDLARILSYCIQESPESAQFLAITRTSDYSFRDADKKGNYSCHNHNALLTMMEGAVSGKTGFTGGAGYCYTGAVEDEGRLFAIALLGCGWPPHKTYKWSDAKVLFDYGKENYRYRNLYREVELMPVWVEDGIREGSDRAEEGCGMEIRVDPQKKELTMLVGDRDRVKIVKKIPEVLNAPVPKGKRVGEIEYYLNDVKIASYPVLAGENIIRFSFAWCMNQVERMFFMQNRF